MTGLWILGEHADATRTHGPSRGSRAIRRQRGRRGVTSLLAMLYLAIIGMLAVGFYAGVTTSAKVAYNDSAIARAQVAAEAGLEFMRYQMARVVIPPMRTGEDLIAEIRADLESQMHDTGNLGARTLGGDSEKITIPDIDLGSRMRFSAVVTLSEGAGGTEAAVSVTGSYGDTTALGRSSGMLFQMKELPSSVFDYGVASRSPITMASNAEIRGVANPSDGQVLVASYGTPALKAKTVSGKVSLVNPNGTATGNINGTSTPQYGTDIIRGVPEPEFPTVDTSAYEAYATNIVTGSSGGNLKNIRIKAGSNPTFTGKIEGVIYIETPNNVRFDSDAGIVGVIVVQNDPTGDVSTNTITLDSNTTMKGVDQLPATADFPPELRAMSGSLILAPTFKLTLNSNAAVLGGSIVASQMLFDSNAISTITGNLINLEETALHMDSNSIVEF